MKLIEMKLATPAKKGEVDIDGGRNELNKEILEVILCEL